MPRFSLAIIRSNASKSGAELRRVDGFELFVIEVTHESESVDGDKNV